MCNTLLNFRETCYSLKQRATTVLEIKCPKALKPFKKKYHLEMTEGKMRGFSVFKIIIEYVSKEWEEITMVTVFG